LKNKEIEQFSATYCLSHIDQGLLRQAFTHSSASKKNNERLEFLGDAILGCIIADKLYEHLPQAKEDYLTRLRAHLVNKKALAQLAKQLDFSSILILGPGERKTGGRQRDSILADALEAVIAAIFLSLGYDKTRDFVLHIYTINFLNLPVEADLKDPKTCLQEWLQQRGHSIPSYVITSETGKPHAKEFTVQVEIILDENKPDKSKKLNTRASGKSRRAAEQTGAAKLLEMLLTEHS